MTPCRRVPTDDFFADYLHGLSTLAAHQGARRVAAAAHLCASGKALVRPTLSTVLLSASLLAYLPFEPTCPSAAESVDLDSGMGNGPGASHSCALVSAAEALPTAITLSGSLHSGSLATGGSMANGASGTVPVMLGPRFQPLVQQFPAAAVAAGWHLRHGGLVALPGQLGMMAAAPAVVPLGLLGVAGMAGKAEGKQGSRSAPSNQRQATNRQAQKRYRRGLLILAGAVGHQRGARRMAGDLGMLPGRL